MPLDLALHKINALTKCRICNHNMRSGNFRLEHREGLLEEMNVVTINLLHIPAEGFPFWTHRRHAKHIICITEGLLPIQVNESHQICQPMM